jgi:hypothetical protein
MNDRSTQHLSEAFDSIITMMLRAIRAHGWRCLVDLPKMLLLAFYLRRLGREFAAVMAAFQAGTLRPAVPPPGCEPPEVQSASAGSPEAPQPTARPAPAARDRQGPALRAALPAGNTGPDPRAADGACCAAVLPHARGRATVRLRPFAVPALDAGVIATARSC